MRQKTMVIDSRLAIVEAVNSDNRSFRLNFEITGVVADPRIVQEVGKMLTDDLAISEEWDAARLDRYTFRNRIKARATALLAPVL